MPENEPNQPEARNLWDQMGLGEETPAPADTAQGDPPSDGEGTQDKPDELAIKIRQQLEEEVINALVEERTDSPFYKGMQKALSKRDRQLQEVTQARERAEAALAELRAQQESLNEGMKFLSEKLFGSMSEEQRAEIVQELQVRRLDKIEKDNQSLRERLNKPAAAPAPVTSESDGDEEFEALMKREVEEAVASMRDTAKEFGLDPADKRLDYGKDDEKFAVRFKKLNASIAAAIKANEEAEVDSVRPKAPITPTRSGEGRAPDDSEGRTLLRRGSDKLLEEMRAATPVRR